MTIFYIEYIHKFLPEHHNPRLGKSRFLEHCPFAGKLTIKQRINSLFNQFELFRFMFQFFSIDFDCTLLQCEFCEFFQYDEVLLACI